MPNQDQPTTNTPNESTTTTSDVVIPVTTPVINDTPAPPIPEVKPLSPTPISTEPIADVPPPPMMTSAESGDMPAAAPLPNIPVTGTDQALPPLNVSPVVVTGGSGGNLGKKKGRKGLVVAVLGLLLLVGGVGAGIFLTGQKQEIREEAAGEETPAPTPTATATAAPISYGCKEIRTYKVTGDVTEPTNWTLLTAAELKLLKDGDFLFITAVGTSIDTEAENGGFDKAEFTINGGTSIESTNIKPKAVSDTNAVEYYYKYPIPEETNTFNIKARLHHETAGWM